MSTFSRGTRGEGGRAVGFNQADIGEQIQVAFFNATVRDDCQLLKFISCDTVPNLWYSGELVTQSG